MSDNRGWVYWSADDNAYVYRASSLGSCIRSLTAARLGEDAFPFNSTIRAAMDASSGLEDEIIRRFKIEMASDEVIWQQREVELVVPNVDPEKIVGWGEPSPVIVRGHLDGLYQLDDSVIEVKALGDSNWNKYKDAPNAIEGLYKLGSLGDKYRIQMGIYGHATERKVRLVVGHKVKYLAEGQVIDADGTVATRDTWKIDEVDISPPIDPSDLYSLSDLHARIQFIEECAAKDELPDCDSNCREGDPYSEAHLWAGPATGDDALLAKLSRIEELKELVGSDDRKRRWGLLGELANLKDEVKEEWGNDYQTEKVTIGPFTASIVPNRGKEFIDGAWLRKNHPDVAVAATRIGKPFHTLIIKRAKGE